MERLEHIKTLLRLLPNKPGVYLMLDQKGTVIYVGKAKNLKRRVSSYFNHRNFPSPKLQRLVASVYDLCTIRVNTEAEALIVESRLIKKLQPFFNVDLKMGAKYPYVVLTDEPFPRLVLTRNKSLQGRYFGPYTAAKTLKNVLRLVDKLFPLRDCKMPLPLKRPIRPCLNHSLGKCGAPCALLETQAEYNRKVDDVVLLLSGRTADLIAQLRSRMNRYAGELQFERAAEVRDAIRSLWRLTRQKVNHELSEDLDEDAWQGMTCLQQYLKLPIVPWRIDGFDISHHAGCQTYGVSVVFEQGVPAKSLYRKYKIRSVDWIDDFRSMLETVTRKYTHVLNNELPLPQLILIDGGPEQLKFAQQALEKLDLTIPMVSLAKKEELIFYDPEQPPLVLPRNDPGLRLLQRVRDESHRFGITAHRSSSAARLSRSSLEQIPGIGKHTAACLLRAYGSMAQLAELTEDQLCHVKGIGPKTAAAIRRFFAKQ